jgi:hypothetical protein
MTDSPNRGGRPAGSQNKVTLDARLRLEAFLAEHGEGIERRLLDTRDDRVLFEVWRLALYYAHGKPKERLQVETSSFSAEGILMALWQKGAPAKPPLLLAAGGDDADGDHDGGDGDQDEADDGDQGKRT